MENEQQKHIERLRSQVEKLRRQLAEELRRNAELREKVKELLSGD